MWRFLFRLWSFFVPSAKLWMLLDQTGILVFVGPNGSGKSLVMVESQMATLDGRRWSCYDLEHRHHVAFQDHALMCSTCDVGAVLSFMPRSHHDLSAAAGAGHLCAQGQDLIESSAHGDRLVYSTVPLTASKGVPHPLYRPLTDYQQLLTIEHADVLFDEVAGIADASGSSSMPVQVINWQHKLRKADIRQRVTTPAYARCALPIRQVAQVVVECKSFAPKGSSGLLWRPRRIVKATAYDAWAFEDFVASDGQRDKLKPIAKGLVWVPEARALDTYNTFGQVLQLGHVTDSGMCITCGGTRSRPKCACTHETEGLDPSLIEVRTETTPAGTRVKKAVLRDLSM